MLRIEKNFLNIKNIFSIIQEKNIKSSDIKILLIMMEDIKKPKDIIIMSRKRLAKKADMDLSNLNKILNRLIDLELIKKEEVDNIYTLGSVLYEDIDFKKSKL